jgi:hypothetical protein
VITLYRDLGIIPLTLPVLRRGYPAWGMTLPQAWSPADVAELPQLARTGLGELDIPLIEGEEISLDEAETAIMQEDQRNAYP